MRLLVAPPPTWPQPLAYPGAAEPAHLHPVRLGQVVAVASTAASAAKTGYGFSSGAYGFDTTGQALSTTGNLLMLAAPIPVVGWVAAAVGALLTIAGSFFGGKPKLSHAQREALEVQRVGGTVNSMIGQIRGAVTLDELWAVLKSWQSGYVGGTSSVAVPIYFRPPGGDEGTAESNVAMKQAMRALVASGGILLPPKWNQDIDAYMTGTNSGDNYTGAMGGTFPGNQNQWYPVYTKQGFYSLFEQHPDWIRANTQAGVLRSMLDPINTAVRNALLNQLQNLGFRFTPGGGGAQLLGTAAPVPSGPDTATVSAWVTQAYQQLLGRAPSSTEVTSAASSLIGQQMSPTQFLTMLTSSAEFQLAHGTTATVTPTGAVVTGGAATMTGQPLSTYWWQNALLAPNALRPAGQPILAASMLPSSASMGTGVSPWFIGVGVLGFIGVLLVAARPPARRRR